ncbi:O-antigen ligase family protein [Paenibacillus tianjinensis]|uniref:O-antigen ligase family protein n=1 Tax=Paenibacillus tianjinensis TaxID=2810347 RepID=A0ABX7L982_9BACL|nr:O-antigen ligase family protein [Paenibacillus tianjinensis]QSF44466.1 O-antigen ligase family protein [Paenibacillus tianjinensis]
MSYKGMGRLQVVAAWGSGILVTTAAAAACLLRGMFFAREMYGLLAVWFVLSAAVAASSIYINGGYKSGGTAVKIILGGPLLILVLYAVHLLRSPLSVQGTVNELLRWGLYSSFALAAFLCAGTRCGSRLLAAVWHGLGITVSLSALLTVCGGLPLRYAVAYTASPEISATGARLGGLLQYPNAFGALMAIFLLERMFALAAGDATARYCSRGEHRVFRAARQPLRMLPLFPYAAALLLSESRGAVLAAACAAAAALLWKRRLAAPLLAAGAAPVAAAALLYRQLARAGLAVEPLPGLLQLAGCWAGALLAGLWLCRRSRRAAGGNRAALLLAAALWTAAGSAVLGQLCERISGPSATVNARGLMYRDAWKLAGEAPWLGQGGETWHSAYLAAQSRPYVGSQVHSGYLDFLLNLGIAGVAVLLLLLLAAVWMTGRDAPRLLPPLLVIVLHAAADFDWSYGLSWLLLFLLLAMVHAESLQRLTAASAASSAILHPASNRSHFRGILMLKRAGLRLILICICLGFSQLSLQMMMGGRLYSQAVRTAEPADQIMLLRQSLAWNPRDPKAAVVLAGLLPGVQGRDLLRSSLIYAPEDPGLHWALAEAYMAGADPGQALYWVRRSLQLDGFNAAKRANAAAGMLEMGRRNLVKGDRQRAADSASAGLELLRQYRLLAVQERSKGRQHNDRRFEYTESSDKLNMELEQLLAAVYTSDEAPADYRQLTVIPSSAGQ